MRYCVDCKHFKPYSIKLPAIFAMLETVNKRDQVEYATCLNPDLRTPVGNQPLCQEMRWSGGQCGPDAFYWEPK